MKLKGMKEQLKDEYGIEVDNRRLWRARRYARGEVHGSHAKSYAKLRNYAAMILHTNPRSVAIIQSELVPVETYNEKGELVQSVPPIMKPQYKRIFVCYEGVKVGFLVGCRHFFGLDGCHLKSLYKGILLSAIGLDANLHFYPIAYAMVEAENNESWRWFMEHLMEQIGERHPNGQHWCILSDRQKGLNEAGSHVPDNHDHYCYFHIENNMVKEFGTSYLKNMFWATTETGNFQTFQRIMDQIKEFNKDA
ncbi:uncharacterized protein LOC133791789 [Humulus lupulus]|uniref:uncharacterized protein LOC133791789 n=1 Tax=Humulus lupulus TaxID=3486 RepID=UPI002B4008F2|nr:uncharacterized protein LOC133791789 [Humulus lupulus]